MRISDWSSDVCSSDLIETELDDFEDRPVIYDPAEIARAGAFVSIDGDGRLKHERGYVRPEEEAQNEADGEAADAFVRDPLEIVHVGADGDTRPGDPGTARPGTGHTAGAEETRTKRRSRRRQPGIPWTTQ